mmetsp:Transcript_92468/g.260720  ORF Transcript_92468/g.260720 Transcript_92468/m.260720 type:complete len:416 (-) Transcript_92468:10-1257(-)
MQPNAWCRRRNGGRRRAFSLGVSAAVAAADLHRRQRAPAQRAELRLGRVRGPRRPVLQRQRPAGGAAPGGGGGHEALRLEDGESPEGVDGENSGGRCGPCAMGHGRDRGELPQRGLLGQASAVCAGAAGTLGAEPALRIIQGPSRHLRRRATHDRDHESGVGWTGAVTRRVGEPHKPEEWTDLLAPHLLGSRALDAAPGAILGGCCHCETTAQNGVVGRHTVVLRPRCRPLAAGQSCGIGGSVGAVAVIAVDASAASAAGAHRRGRGDAIEKRWRQCPPSAQCRRRRRRRAWGLRLRRHRPRWAVGADTGGGSRWCRDSAAAGARGAGGRTAGPRPTGLCAVGARGSAGFQSRRGAGAAQPGELPGGGSSRAGDGPPGLAGVRGAPQWRHGPAGGQLLDGELMRAATCARARRRP